MHKSPRLSKIQYQVHAPFFSHLLVAWWPEFSSYFDCCHPDSLTVVVSDGIDLHLLNKNITVNEAVPGSKHPVPGSSVSSWLGYRTQ